ncbi:MAG: coiled-coil domain-containing protein [Coriobacteriales bacterium]|jgi:peptidoglycan hydrolase CwlO-like protein
MDSSLRKGVTAFAVCLVLTMCMLLVNAGFAHADDEVAELNVKVEETAKQYNEAKQKVADIEKRITDNEAKIKTLQAEIDEQQAVSNDAVRSLYIYQRQTPSLINLVFSTDDVHTLFGTLDYLNRYENKNMSVINEQIARKEDLEATGVQLEKDMAEATKAEQEAETALKEAQAAREEAMQRAAEEAARQLKEAQEAAAREAAEKEAQAELERQQAEEAAADESEAAGEDSENPEYEGDENAVAEGSISSSDVAWDSPKEDFVNTWAGRINNYLAGSPLSGYGENFAVAAWDYGVDPRWSPAISCVESSKGAICFRSHNAWGWGNSGWGSWEEAIDAHVSGLSRGYGFSLTLGAAKKYCPPTYQDWYNRCLSEMNKI